MASPSAANVWGATVVNRSSAAATAFLVWDVLITLADEVHLVWSKPNAFRTKWLFFFVRYFALALQLSLIFVGTDVAATLHYPPRACTIWYIVQEASTQLLIAAVEIVLIVRVQALYLQHPIITRTLYALFALENVCMTTALVFAVPRVEFDAACVVTRSPFALVYFAAAFGAFETLLFVLTLLKFATAVCAGWGDTPVLTVLVRDGTWAFALVFVALCVNAACFLGAPSAMGAAAFQWLISAESFAGARLILNVLALDAAHSSSSSFPFSSSDEYSSGLTSEMRFSSTVGAGEARRETRTRYGYRRGRRARVWGMWSARTWWLDESLGATDTDAFEMTVESSEGTGTGTRSGNTRSGTHSGTAHSGTAGMATWEDREGPVVVALV